MQQRRVLHLAIAAAVLLVAGATGSEAANVSFGIGIGIPASPYYYPYGGYYSGYYPYAGYYYPGYYSRPGVVFSFGSGGYRYPYYGRYHGGRHYHGGYDRWHRRR